MSQPTLAGGLSAFSSGYQVGSPAFAGFGPAGAIAGAAVGITGGILGARKQRKFDHQQAAAQWEEMRPQYEAFDRSISGEGSFALREWLDAQDRQLKAYKQVPAAAWQYGHASQCMTHPVSPLDSRFRRSGRA